jgi:hypothetical protein
MSRDETAAPNMSLLFSITWLLPHDPRYTPTLQYFILMLDFTIKTEQHWYLPDHAVGIETADNIAWIELLYKPLDFSLTCSYRGYLRKLPIINYV